MLSRLIPYVSLLVSIYLLVSLAKDISCYYKLLATRRAELEREEIMRAETLSRLRSLIQLEEKEEIDRNNEKRWVELHRRLQIED
jgi:hypothetical protein